MIDWQTFWLEHPASVDRCDHLMQVGHTVEGKSYSPAQFQSMLGSISRSLHLEPGCKLLDVCCGNGVVTAELSKQCKAVLGVDFSPTLLRIAKSDHAPENVQYCQMDARNLSASNHPEAGSFDRVLMYAALQHFEMNDLETLLESFFEFSTPNAIFLLGGVLDAERKHNFLDTPEKQQMYLTYKREGRDRLGTWWEPDHIIEVCERIGLRCDIDSVSAGRPGGHYRFDARITH